MKAWTVAMALLASSISFADDAKPAHEAPLLSQLHQSYQRALELSQLAQVRASSDPVKALAQTIADGCRRLDNALIEYAAGKDMVGVGTALAPVPLGAAAPGEGSTASLEGLQVQTGADFDRAYLAAVVPMLRHSQALLEGARPRGDAAFESLVKGARSSIQAHLTEAARLQKTLPSGTS